MMFSKIAVLSLLASVASVSGKSLRADDSPVLLSHGRVLGGDGIYCPYSCHEGCEGECKSYGCMNDSVFNPSQCSNGVLDKKCDLNSDGECEASDCCVPEPTACEGSQYGKPLSCRQACAGKNCRNANRFFVNSGGEFVNGYCSTLSQGAVCCAGEGCTKDKID